MPIDYMARKQTAEKGVEDFLANREQGIATDILKTAGTVDASRGRFRSNLASAAGEAAGKYGLEPTPIDASIAPVEKDLDRANQEAIGLRKMRERKERTNQVYGMMFDRLTNAGLDRQQAEAVATQFAADEDARAFQSSEAAKDREATVKNQDMKDEFADRQIAMERQAESEQRQRANRTAIIRSLFGIGATIGTGFALRGMGAPKG